MSEIIALTGPPAVGKSTICGFFQDFGVPTIRTGDGIRSEAEYRHEDPDENDIWETAQHLRQEYGPAGPTIACADMIKSGIDRGNGMIVVSDLRDQAEVEWIRENYSDPLVVRIDAPRVQRINRYIDREIGRLDMDESREFSRSTQLAEEYAEREERESPYPKHHVSIINDDDVKMDELMYRIQGICSFADPDGTYEAVTMA